MVTAELAVAIPSVVLVLALCLVAAKGFNPFIYFRF